MKNVNLKETKSHAHSNNKILFTGGGTAGHVIPNLALCKKLKQHGWEAFYIGSKQGIEKELLTTANIIFYTITTGKLRRYICWQNFIDPFKFFWGILEAWHLCRRIKPNVVFSKGGFVALPVVLGAWLNRIPVIVHESDLTPGLANRISFPFAKKICLTFVDTKKYLAAKNKSKSLLTGTPIRIELFKGNAKMGQKICNFLGDKKIIFVQGGGLGSDSINNLTRKLLPSLLPNFDIVHSCGKGKTVKSLEDIAGYKQFEYIAEELPHILAAADLVISRAGANSVYELLALKKINLLLPLSHKASRGDQLANAKYCTDFGVSRVIYPQNLTAETLLQEIHWLFEHTDEFKKTLSSFNCEDSITVIYDLLSKFKKQGFKVV